MCEIEQNKIWVQLSKTQDNNRGSTSDETVANGFSQCLAALELKASCDPRPRASQLAFVWVVSAWLTSALAVRGGFLCPDLAAQLKAMRGGVGWGVGVLL